MTYILEITFNKTNPSFMFLGSLIGMEEGNPILVDVVEANTVWRLKGLLTNAGHRIDYINDKTQRQGHTK